MNDHDALLRAVLEYPDEDCPRLVFADWLDENEQHDRAEFIRLQCEISSIQSAAPTIGPPESCSWLPKAARRVTELSRRERELHRCSDHSLSPVLPGVKTVCSRGFVSEIEISLAEFMQYSKSIFQSQPVTRVVLTDREPHPGNGGIGWRVSNDLHYEANIPIDLIGHCETYVSLATFGWSRFPTREHAIDAISTACVSFGRAAAGLTAREPALV